MTAFVTAPAGFLLAVLWFDLMFDVQALTNRSGDVPEASLDSISAYYSRVTSADAYVGMAEYIRNNPVIRHLIAEATLFPHSSAFPGFVLDPPPQGLKPDSNQEL